MNNTKAKKKKEGSLLYAKFQRSSEVPAIILFLIRKRIVKTEGAAIALILFLVIVFIMISINLFLTCFTHPVFINTIN
jgi:hypothetical protein